MARSLASKPNVVAPGGDYPYGKVKNKSSAIATDGTPISEQVYGDFHQFFEKLLDDAGITANDLPENSANGFQYNEALSVIAGFGAWKDSDTTPTLTATGGGTVAFYSPSATKSRYQKKGKTITWSFGASLTIAGVVNRLTLSLPTSFTLPTGQLWKVFSGGYHTYNVRVQIDGTEAIITMLDGSNFNIGTGFYLTFTSVIEID